MFDFEVLILDDIESGLRFKRNIIVYLVNIFIYGNNNNMIKMNILNVLYDVDIVKYFD